MSDQSITADLDSTYMVDIDGDKATVSISLENLPYPVARLLRDKAEEIGKALHVALFEQLGGKIVAQEVRETLINGHPGHGIRTVN